MAFGFPPKHTRQLPLPGLSPEQFIALSVITMEIMEWRIVFIHNRWIKAYTNNGMLSWNAEVDIRIEDSIINITSASTNNAILDWGKNDRNIGSFLVYADEQRLLYTPEQLYERYLDLQTREEIIDDRAFEERKKKINAFSILIPKKKFFITPLLIDLNILVFIIMAISGAGILQPSNESLLQWGANFRPLTLNGQWWRLFTNFFLHIGILHLLMNMYALLYIGILLEPRMGKARFLTAYILTGLVASINSIWWHDAVLSAGASGAIFGMYGVFLAMLMSNLIEKKTRKPLLTSILFFVSFNLLYGMKAGIDNAAHLGGFISGLVIGYAFIPSIKQYDKKSLKFSTIGVLTIATIAGVFIAFKNISNDLPKYEEVMKTFETNESMALEVFSLGKDASEERILDELKNRGIYYWNENLKLLDKADSLDLPETIQDRDMELRNYCNLRIQAYGLMAKSIEEHTEQYKGQIKKINQQIADIFQEIKGNKQ